MKSVYVISFLLGVSIWFNIQYYLEHVDKKIKAAYEQGYDRGKLDEKWINLENSIKDKIDSIKRDVSQTPGK